MADIEGYVLQHRLIAEKILGKPLPEGAEVHHVDGNGQNNEHTNLVICQDSAYHWLLHRRKRAMDACGHADWLKCRFCGNYEDPANLSTGIRPAHRSCVNEYTRKRRAK